MNITCRQTRQMSFDDITDEAKTTRYKQILRRLETPKTAKEIAVELFDLRITNTTERNTCAPRLTELERMDMVKVISKKKCVYTGKSVAVYERTQKGFEAINSNKISRAS